MMPRWIHNLWAKLNGYFWLACPVCGRMFGGHEVRHAVALIDAGQCVCPDPQCIYEAGVLNALDGHSAVMIRPREVLSHLNRRLGGCDMMITTEMAAKEYARLYQPADSEELNDHYRRGLALFSDMSRFSDHYRRQSLDAFSNQFIAPLIIKELKNGRGLPPATQKKRTALED